MSFTFEYKVENKGYLTFERLVITPPDPTAFTRGNGKFFISRVPNVTKDPKAAEGIRDIMAALGLGDTHATFLPEFDKKISEWKKNNNSCFVCCCRCDVTKMARKQEIKIQMTRALGETVLRAFSEITNPTLKRGMVICQYERFAEQVQKAMAVSDQNELLNRKPEEKEKEEEKAPLIVVQNKESMITALTDIPKRTMVDLKMENAAYSLRADEISNTVKKALEENNAFENFQDIMSQENLKNRKALAAALKDVYIKYPSADQDILYSKLGDAIITWKCDCQDNK